MSSALAYSPCSQMDSKCGTTMVSVSGFLFFFPGTGSTSISRSSRISSLFVKLKRMISMSSSGMAGSYRLMRALNLGRS